MAEVFRAHDNVLDRPVAVKVFRAEHVAHDDASGVERQQLEVAALARLNHPNLIALYDGSIGGQSEHDYIVMELIDGPSLAARIAEGPLPEPSVREIGIQLADGLAYVHAQGMVHRDVKPENILLGVDRSDDDHTVRARLSDFGIVRLLGSERLTSVNFTLGTASYLAPEQARGSAVDPPADLYSLGLVLLESLTGRRMFDGPPLEAAMARLSQRPHVPAGLPAPWPGLLHAMTEFDPALRPSATDVARILRNEGSRALPLVPLAVPVAAGLADAPTGMIAVPAAAAAQTSGQMPRRRRRPSAMAITAAASLLIVLTTLGIFLLAGNDTKTPAQTPTTNPSPAAKHSSSAHHSARPTTGTTTQASVSSAPASSASKSKSAATSSSAAPSHSSAPKTSSAAPPPPNTHSRKPPATSAAASVPASSAPASSAPASSAAASSAGATSSNTPASGATSTG